MDFVDYFISYLGNKIALDQHDRLRIRSKVHFRRYLKGHFILQQGDYCKNLNFIVSGLTKTYTVDQKGKEHVFRFAIKNWWASDLPSFYQKEPSISNIYCLEETNVIQISNTEFELLIKEVPQMEHFFRLLFQDVSIALEKRIINGFSLSAKKRYLLFLKEYPEFEQRIPQYLIASYLGITKQYLSEIRNQLALQNGSTS